MRNLLIAFSISLLIISCAQHAGFNKQLQSQIDSLKTSIRKELGKKNVEELLLYAVQKL